MNIFSATKGTHSDLSAARKQHAVFRLGWILDVSHKSKECSGSVLRDSSEINLEPKNCPSLLVAKSENPYTGFRLLLFRVI